MWCQCPFSPWRPPKLVNPPWRTQKLFNPSRWAIPELGQAAEHLPPLSVLRVFPQSSAGKEELIITPETLIWGIEHFSASPSPNKPKSTLLHLQKGSSRLGSGRGLSLPLELGESWIKERKGPSAHDRGTGFSRGRDPSNPPLQTDQVQHLMENAEIKDPFPALLIPSSAHTQFHVSPPSPAFCLLRIGNFYPLQAGPQGSYILRSVSGFIQPPCSNVSTEESSELSVPLAALAALSTQINANAE